MNDHKNIYTHQLISIRVLLRRKENKTHILWPKLQVLNTGFSNLPIQLSAQ